MERSALTYCFLMLIIALVCGLSALGIVEPQFMRTTIDTLFPLLA